MGDHAVDTLADCLSIHGGTVIHRPVGRFFRRGPAAGHPAIGDITLAFRRGEIWGIAGESGSGKSTLGRALCRLRKLTGGELRIGGRPAETVPRREFCRRVQMIFQSPLDALNPARTVRQSLLEPLRLHFPRQPREWAARRMENLLAMVHLPAGLLDRMPDALSGGQRQQVAIARALAVEPEFLICDEVVSALDMGTRRKIVDLLLHIQSSMGLGLICIDHDLSLIGAICPSLAVLGDGRLLESGKTAEIFSHPSHAATRELLLAVL
jgi:ABC-type glutathione transport system ATPase component